MRLIDADALVHDLIHKRSFYPVCVRRAIEDAPTVDAKPVDAVGVDALKAWLYEIAMNNTDNYLGDACEEIISRLDGLRAFARERRTDADNRC